MLSIPLNFTMASCLKKRTPVTWSSFFSFPVSRKTRSRERKRSGSVVGYTFTSPQYAVGCGNYANLQIFFHSKTLSNQFYCVLRLGETRFASFSSYRGQSSRSRCKHGLCLVARVKKGTGNNCLFLFLSFTYCKISTTTFLSLFEEAAFTTVRIAFAMRP